MLHLYGNGEQWQLEQAKGETRARGRRGLVLQPRAGEEGRSLAASEGERQPRVWQPAWVSEGQEAVLARQVSSCSH